MSSSSSSDGWPAGRHPTGTPVEAAPRAAPGSFPVPPGRGRWRLLVLDRAFASGRTWGDLAVAELSDARSRRLEQKYNAPAAFTFTVDGHSPAATEIVELMSDVLALRWDDQTGADIPVFRGIVTQSQDTISEQAHTVTFTCHDYAAVLWRRLISNPYGISYTQTDQDTIVAGLFNNAISSTSSYTVPGWTDFRPGSFLPMAVSLLQPNGASRAYSGVKRDRTYPGNTIIGQAIADLGQVSNGYDWQVRPFATSLSGVSDLESLDIYYPYQGTTRTAPALVYGSTVSSISRSVNSGDYANYVRTVGNKASVDPAAIQVFGEAWNTDSNDISRNPIGLWSKADNASDVSVAATLLEQAAGELALDGMVVPNYTIGLRPDVYAWGSPRMGDVLPLVIHSGRLNVNTTIRIVGLTYDIGDDGDENVELEVGRPAVTLPYLLRQSQLDTSALARR